MKVLVVDDSLVFRSAITRAIEGASGYTVVKNLSNGKLAVDYLKDNDDVDLVTLDVEMPVMDGIETIREIRKFNRRIIIIVFSSLTLRGAEKTIEALTLGANDFVPKIQATGVVTVDESIRMIQVELMPRIDACTEKLRDKMSPALLKNSGQGSSYRSSSVSEAGRDGSLANNHSSLISAHDSEGLSLFDFKSTIIAPPDLICIGASTGGPDALNKLFSKIKNVPKIPILIVQHMPPLFTAKLANALNTLSPVEVKEAVDGEEMRPGVCYIAPGDFHMSLVSKGHNSYLLRMDQNEKVCFVRPSVDVLFKSIADNFKGRIKAFVLTGMGADGADGASFLAKKGHPIYVQDKSTSAVWGMPAVTYKKNPNSKIMKIEDIGLYINENFR